MTKVIKSTVSSCYFEKNAVVHTVKDVEDRGYNLEPLKCVHCGHVGEVTYLQYVGDGQCGVCGEWQKP